MRELRSSGGRLTLGIHVPELYPLPMRSMLKELACICSWVGPFLVKTPNEKTSGKLSNSSLPICHAAKVDSTCFSQRRRL